MSENFHRAVDDLDRGGQANFQDARQALLEEVRQGADARRLVQAVNQKELEPGHAGAQIQLATDRQGYLDIVPANYANNQQPYERPSERPYEGQQPQYQQGVNPGEVAGAVGLGIIAGAIGGALLNRGRGHEEHYEPRRRFP